MAVANNTKTSEFDTETLWQQDQDHFIHPMSVWPSYKQQGCTVLVRGEGPYVFDSDGNRYLDTNGGLWAVNIGYGRAEMAHAIAAQVLALPQANHYGDCTTVPGVELAARLAKLAPGSLNHVFFSNGGSLANDSAIRIAHHYFMQSGRPEKKHVITRLDGYHGSTYLTASMSGTGFRKARFHYIEDFVHHVSSPGMYRRPAGTTAESFCALLVAELEQKILAIGADRVACFVTEPIPGIGGVLEPPPGYHPRMLEICRKYDVLYIHDEVITAFGRLGHMFASEDVYGVTPDIINVAKGITSGYQPLAATIISDGLFDVISDSGKDAPFAQGYTYTGHPVCCAAALTNLDILEREQICEHVRDDIGPYFEEKFATLADSPLVGDARGHSSIFCLEHVADKDSKETLPIDVEVGQRIANAARQRGLIVRGVGNLVVISPPLIIEREHIDTIGNVLHECEQAVAEDLLREGLWHG